MIRRLTRLFNSVAALGVLRLLIASWLVLNLFGAETFLFPLKAHADVGGEQYSPGQCPYPAIGGFGLDGVAQHYECQFPLEINNSRHTCIYGGAAATVGANISLLIFSASIQLPLGVLEGICYWACPNLSVAPEPDPIQTWQGNSQAYTPVGPHRIPCKELAPNPVPPEPAAAPEPPPPVANETPGPVLPQQQPSGGEPGGGPL